MLTLKPKMEILCAAQCGHDRILGRKAFVGLLGLLLHSSGHGLKERKQPTPFLIRINVNIRLHGG
jgi:hypothetical protein